jgi:hypothetical protein
LDVCEDARIIGKSVRDGFDVPVSKSLVVSTTD